MTLPPSAVSRIIRGAKIEGIVFYSAGEQSPSETVSHSSIEEAIKKAERDGLEHGQWQGYEAGKSEGYESGFKQGQKSSQLALSEAVSLLALMASEFKEKQEKVFEELKPDIIKLCLNISETLIKHELADKQRLLNHLISLLTQSQSLLAEATVEVHLSSEDYAMVHSALDQSVSSHDELKAISFISDKNVDKGDCFISSSLGMLNFNIKRLLNDFEVRLLGSL